MLLFENRFTVPPWLQVTGRMHPLLVHFPIVLVVLYALASFLPVVKKPDPSVDDYTINDAFLFLAAFTSVVAALMGLFLSREEGYDPEALQWHKWSGVALSAFSLGWYYFRRQLQSVRFLPYGMSLLALTMIVVTGHQGASITHGQNFLLAPVLSEKEKPVVPFDEAMVYADMVKPILSEKCMSCHNDKKAKGDLVMESEESLLKGGKTGLLWDSTAADFGLLLQRVHLPLEQKKHMPPQGKPQLTDQELEIIEGWIRRGSNFTLKASDLPADDTLRIIAARYFMDSETAHYDFEEADPATVRKLNTSNRVVASESLNSPALKVSFFNSQLFNIEQLKELLPVKKQIVSLDLSKMPVKDADLKIISEFENLRRLHLNFTAISGSTLGELQRLKFLRTLAVAGTKVGAKELDHVKNFPKLKTVYAWNIPVDTVTLKRIQQNAKSIVFETGFQGDTITLKLSPPILQNEEPILTNAVPLKLKHYLPGVTIRFTTDGTDPDSIRSAVYKPGGIMIDGMKTIRAKAYKPGWKSSDVIEKMFLKHGQRPDTVTLLTPTDSSYSGSGTILNNLDKGSTNFRDGSWIAWRRLPMEVLLEYKKPVPVQTVTLSSIVDLNRHIFPPLNVEIWGGDDKNNLKLLGKMKPGQAGSMTKDSLRKQSAYLTRFECKIQPSTIKFIKIVGTPIPKLPSWHPDKGKPGYIFVDEILVN